ncbi:MAG TPA: hypothetical protein VKQ52_02125 [Puia sp.]|nr:hypothetical protein [Puia sp.]
MDIFEQVAEMRVEEKTWEFVTNLLTHTQHPVNEIALLAGVSEDFVKEVKKSLRKRKKG